MFNVNYFKELYGKMLKFIALEKPGRFIQGYVPMYLILLLKICAMQSIYDVIN